MIHHTVPEWIQAVCLVEPLHLDNSGQLENTCRLHQSLTAAWTAVGSEPMSRTEKAALLEPQILVHPRHNKTSD